MSDVEKPSGRSRYIGSVGRAGSRWPLITLTCHLFVVTAVTAGYTLITLFDKPFDANIGGGLLLFGGVGALGLPWSLLVFLGVVDPGSDHSMTALIITFALSNLLIHALLALYLTRRATASGSRQPAGTRQDAAVEFR